jgi:hypothetical protein
LTEVLTASGIRPVPTPNYLTGTTFNMVVGGIPLTRTNSAGATITLPVATYNVDLATLGLNGLSQVGFNTGVRHYVYMAQKRETVLPTVGLVSGLIVAPTAGLTTINISSIDYDLYEITGLDFLSETRAGITAIPTSTFLELNQDKEFLKPGDANSAFAYVNFDSTLPANVSGTATRASNVATINATAHGHIVGHRVYLTFASGISNGWFTVATVPTANSFTVASTGADVVVPVVATLTRRSIRKALNVQSVPYESSGRTAVNFVTAPADANYILAGGGSSRSGIDHIGIAGFHITSTGFVPPTVNAFHILIRTQNASAVDQTDVSIQVFA